MGAFIVNLNVRSNDHQDIVGKLANMKVEAAHRI
jgi:hypothetical protein